MKQSSRLTLETDVHVWCYTLLMMRMPCQMMMMMMTNARIAVKSLHQRQIHQLCVHVFVYSTKVLCV